jgi:ADP-dependent phosphofructokinase/glucokinase
MRTLSGPDWRNAYGATAARLVSGAAAARLILTGTSACVDAIFGIDAERLSRLVARPAATSTGDMAGRELLDRVMGRIVLGRGGELLTRWPAGPAWICALLGPPDRYQVGGTGPQASWALAAVGGRSVLALADRSPEQLAVVDPRTGVCADGEIVTAGSLTPSGSATKLPHCILEFTAGTGHGGVTLPRSSRIILRFGDEPIERDEQYLTMTPTLAAAAGAGLVSGLNGLADEDSKENMTERAWLLALVRAWSDVGLAVIHHELAEFATPGRLRAAAGLGPATSLGLSLSELFTLTGSDGDPRLLARDVAGLSGARRVIVHADDWALAVHRGDERHTEDVLLAGNAVAAARARAGQPTAILDPATDASYTDDLPASGALGDGWRATCVPAPHLRRPTGTVGLGDTFVAGLLLAESLRQADPLAGTTTRNDAPVRIDRPPRGETPCQPLSSRKTLARSADCNASPPRRASSRSAPWTTYRTSPSC